MEETKSPSGLELIGFIGSSEENLAEEDDNNRYNFPFLVFLPPFPFRVEEWAVIDAP